MIVQVAPWDLDEFWPTAEPLLREAMERLETGETLDDVYRQVARANALLWLWQSAGETKMALVLENQDGWLSAWLVGGEDMTDWIDDGLAAMDRYAVEAGLKGCRATTRPGIARALRERGWSKIAEVVQVSR